MELCSLEATWQAVLNGAFNHLGSCESDERTWFANNYIRQGGKRGGDTAESGISQKADAKYAAARKVRHSLAGFGHL
jgi:hypothetical protein